ncbi:hypothetical protein AKJ16_DCAP16955 [Drosera capensis]
MDPWESNRELFDPSRGLFLEYLGLLKTDLYRTEPELIQRVLHLHLQLNRHVLHLHLQLKTVDIRHEKEHVLVTFSAAAR